MVDNDVKGYHDVIKVEVVHSLLHSIIPTIRFLTPII